MKTTTSAALPEPQAGGHYRREADGSLTLLAQTEDVRRRAARPGDVPAAEPAAAEPAASSYPFTSSQE